MNINSFYKYEIGICKNFIYIFKFKFEYYLWNANQSISIVFELIFFLDIKKPFNPN